MIAVRRAATVTVIAPVIVVLTALAAFAFWKTTGTGTGTATAASSWTENTGNNAVGIAWTDVTTTSTNKTINCTGTIGQSNYDCTITKSANNQSFTAKLSFVTAAGVKATSPFATNQTYSPTFANRTSGSATTVTINTGTTTSTGSVGGTMGGSNAASVTVSVPGYGTAKLTLV